MYLQKFQSFTEIQYPIKYSDANSSHPEFLVDKEFSKIEFRTYLLPFINSGVKNYYIYRSVPFVGKLYIHIHKSFFFQLLIQLRMNFQKIKYPAYKLGNSVIDNLFYFDRKYFI